MEIRIIFADESSVFEKSFLEQNYPYFKTLFNSGMKDSRSENKLKSRKKYFFFQKHAIFSSDEIANISRSRNF